MGVTVKQFHPGLTFEGDSMRISLKRSYLRNSTHLMLVRKCKWLAATHEISYVGAALSLTLFTQVQHLRANAAAYPYEGVSQGAPLTQSLLVNIRLD
jgi:hypothetical protein